MSALRQSEDVFLEQLALLPDHVPATPQVQRPKTVASGVGVTVQTSLGLHDQECLKISFSTLPT